MRAVYSYAVRPKIFLGRQKEHFIVWWRGLKHSPTKVNIDSVSNLIGLQIAGLLSRVDGESYKFGKLYLSLYSRIGRWQHLKGTKVYGIVGHIDQ